VKTNVKTKIAAIVGLAVVFSIMMVSVSQAVDNGNGTITVGELVWLKKANCFSNMNWGSAYSAAASLQSGACGLTDGSKAGQWRLPTADELQTLFYVNEPFDGSLSNWFWSSTVCTLGIGGYYALSPGSHRSVNATPDSTGYYVLPVRAK